MVQPSDPNERPARNSSPKYAVRSSRGGFRPVRDCLRRAVGERFGISRNTATDEPHGSDTSGMHGARRLRGNTSRGAGSPSVRSRYARARSIRSRALFSRVCRRSMSFRLRPGLASRVVCRVKPRANLSPKTIRRVIVAYAKRLPRICARKRIDGIGEQIIVMRGSRNPGHVRLSRPTERRSFRYRSTVMVSWSVRASRPSHSHGSRT